MGSLEVGIAGALVRIHARFKNMVSGVTGTMLLR